MKRIVKNSVVAAAFAVPLMVFAAAPTPGSGLLGTVHDFATNAAYMATQTDGAGVAVPGINSVGLCSYCHTPHSALSTSLLWNHNLSGASFTWDDATTTGGTPYATMSPTYKGPSVKCLSCHDGSIAIGDVALYNDKKAAVYNTFKLTGIAQIAKGAGAANMAGNHPIAMPYPFGGAVGTYNTKTTGGVVSLNEFVPDPVNKNGTTVKLFNDNGTGGITGGAIAGKSGIECSSCHDVHNKVAVEDMLLRGKINGSLAVATVAGGGGGYLCLQCHIK